MAENKEQQQPATTMKKDEILQKLREQQAASVGTGGGPTSSSSPSTSGGGALWGGISTRHMAAYCRQLATLVDVGVPLLRSLKILAERSAHPELRRVTADVARRVEEGQAFSSALAAHPRVFSPMFISVVRTGEAGGILEEALRRLSELLERQAEIRRRVVGALIYPVITLIIEIIIIGIIMVYALPKLIAAYPKPEDLPQITRFLMSISTWVAANWLIALIVLAVVVIGFWLFRRTPSGRALTQNIALRLPLCGNLIRKINVERFSRTLGSLTAAGIPLIEALAITAETSDNEVLRRTLLKVRETVERGGKMDEPMRSEPVFDAMVVDMVMVGDEAGALDTMLLKLADIYDSEVDVALRSLSSILEPLLIVFLGLAVGFLAVAVFLPYISLVNNPALVVE